MTKDCNYLIRKVKPDDAMEFIKLKNLVWRFAYKDIFPEEVFIKNESEEKISKLIAGFPEHICNNNSHFAYVAVADNNIIGLATGIIADKHPHFGKNIADFVGLYIHPDYQGLGIASKFRELFESWLKENKIKKYIINVLASNKNARKVYESWGGKLSSYKETLNVLGAEYDLIFYTYELQRN